jgi:hypothetical protein
MKSQFSKVAAPNKMLTAGSAAPAPKRRSLIIDISHANCTAEDEKCSHTDIRPCDLSSSSNEANWFLSRPNDGTWSRATVPTRMARELCSVNSPRWDSPVPSRRTEFLSDAKYATDVFLRLAHIQCRDGGYISPETMNFHFC